MGAICGTCKQDMLNSDGCKVGYIRYKNDEEKYLNIRYQFDGGDSRCHDCNTKEGYAHHENCDMEICPKCGGQFISCNCEPVSIEVEN